ncbi:hypothetical protein LIER_06044 [Lithospermum erythrorhizon]|uniref:Uncharacterized protein n=1 Tax=Lithospermum erythrorhizon TaxID=34254 RepID=A0AAV3P335_LITER
MVLDAPPATQPSKKAKTSSGVQKKKGSQPLARDSSVEGSWHPSPVEAVVTRPPVVTLDFSTTVSDQDMGRRTETADRRLSLRQELSTLLPSPAQQAVVEEEILFSLCEKRFLQLSHRRKLALLPLACRDTRVYIWQSPTPFPTWRSRVTPLGGAPNSIST